LIVHRHAAIGSRNSCAQRWMCWNGCLFNHLVLLSGFP
jgi:hypothetical protein